MKCTNFIKPAAIILSMAVLSSCNNLDSDLQGGASIKFKSTYQTTGAKTASARLNSGIIIESFKINVGEIELEFDENDPMFETDSVASDIELKGPFEVDLMKDSTALESTLANVELPAAAYDEIEFEIKESKNSISEMLGKAVLVKGTINDIPFIFWTDEELEVEIEFNEDIKLDEAKKAIISVSFDIASLFDPATGGIDISNAVDGNENGTIEIYPNDPDGNEDLADVLAEKLEDIIDAFEDSFEDEDEEDKDDEEDNS